MTTDDRHEDPITPARFDALVAFLLAPLDEDEAAARTALLDREFLPFESKKTIITGGDSGIGRAVALAFAREGADVLISYLESEEKDAQETVRLIEDAPGPSRCPGISATRPPAGGWWTPRYRSSGGSTCW